MVALVAKVVFQLFGSINYGKIRLGPSMGLVTQIRRQKKWPGDLGDPLLGMENSTRRVGPLCGSVPHRVYSGGQLGLSRLPRQVDRASGEPAFNLMMICA